MNSMDQDDSYDANPEGGQFQPSAKLMEKMDKLAKWRIDPSLIEFPEDTAEFHGGHATVSRAALKTPSSYRGTTTRLRARNNARQMTMVAVKKLKITADSNIERVLGLTLREAGFLVELSHMNIIELKGFVEDVSKGIVWLVFPWEANGNLRDFVASQDWEIPERVSLINDVARGVEYLHGQNPPVCHGDLKSVNILVKSDSRVVITDFGSARRLAEEDLRAETEQVGRDQEPATRLEATFSASTNTITLTGTEFTLRWAAPELLNDKPSTVKVDIWSLGWIAFEVMTNSIPFQDVVKDSIVVRRVTQGHLPAITSDARMSLMLLLCCLMSKCWCTDPSQRPTATDCLKSLNWMPMITPNPNRTAESMEARSPRLLLKLGHMYRQQDDYANALKVCTEALRIFTNAADKKGRADTLADLGQLHHLQGKELEAVMFYSDALEIFTNLGDRPKEARVLNGLALAYQCQGKCSKAVKFYSDALKICTNIGWSSEKSYALYGLAEVHRLSREYSQAVPLYTEALQIRTDIGDLRGRASALWGLAQMHGLQKNYDQAIKFYSDALQIYTDVGDSRGRAFVLFGLADVSYDQGRPKDAIDLYEQAYKIFEQIGNARSAADALGGIANARRQMEQA